MMNEDMFLAVVWVIFLGCIVLAVRTNLRVRRARRRFYDAMAASSSDKR